MKNIKFKKRRRISRNLIAIICVAVCAVIIAGIFIGAKLLIKDTKPPKPEGYTFVTKDFENISSVSCLNETMAVFTDSATGKVGIMTLGGEITEKAEHNKITVCSDSWRNYRYIVESPRSEYLLLADAQTKTVTTRQYHGLQKPEMIPCWSEVGKHLAWTDEKGYAGEVKTKEVSLEPGLYPVATSLGADAKYGYIGRALRLEIAAVYENARDFSEDIAAVKKDGKWGYINNLGVTVIPFEFDSCALADTMGGDIAFGFRNSLAPVCKDGKFGIINSKGETVADFTFDIILQGENGKYIACSGGKWGIITVDKELFVPETTASTAPANNEPAVAQGYYMVKTSGSVLNMRAEADSNSEVVAKIPNGTILHVTKSVSGWSYAKYNSFSGWVSSAFLVEAPLTTASSTQTTVST
ncbi:MAG: WG repeat-containing protein [Clostridia bacterium]|nr:WG repeat-containing protein [Clostridia bacterium]MBR3818487.1 WG repeat-containing protein [Clostridia bacterium]